MEHNPYQAPAADQPAPTTDPLGEHVYVDQSDRVGLLRMLLLAYLVMAVVSAVSGFMQLELLEKMLEGDFTMEQAEANDSRQAIIVILGAVVFIVTAVFFGSFLVRANKNARALSPHFLRLEFSPGGMVGWFFAPFLNLWKPFQAVRETWSVSQPATPGLLGLWWALYVGSGMFNWIASKMGETESLSGLQSSTWVGIFGDALQLALALAAMGVIAGLHRVQQQHHQTGQQVPL